MSKQYKDFIVLERIPKAPLYIFSLADADFVNTTFRDKLGIKNVPGQHLNIYEGEDFLFCYQLDSLRKCTEEIFEKMINNPKWGIELDDLILKNSKKFIEYSTKVEKMDISELSDKELAQINDDWFFKYFHDSWTIGWPAVLVDFERNLFSNHLLNYLKNKIKEKKYEASVGDVFSALTTPIGETFAQLETVSLLGLVRDIKKDKKLVDLLKTNTFNKIIEDWPGLNEKIWHEFSLHYKKYCWLPFMYTGPSWDREYFIDSLIHLLKQNIDIEEELKKIKNKKEQTEQLHDKYIRDLEIHDKHQILFDVARRFVFSKSYRKDTMYYGCYVMDKVLREIAKRKYLSVQQVRRLYPWEIGSFLEKEEPSTEVLSERKYAVQYSDDDSSRLTYEGKKARDFVKKINFIKQKTEKPKEILGDCASVGKVRGVVKIINSPEDMNKMKEGNVLVSYATSPDIMPAIRKSVAIVTDLGGIICHAAIVSRELHIPCVVGTRIATKVLKNGDLVEVDATHGIIRIIK